MESNEKSAVQVSLEDLGKKVVELEGDAEDTDAK